MGCSGSIPLAEGDDFAFIEEFVDLCREDYGWDNKSRAQDGPRGTKVTYKMDADYSIDYWRGSAVFRAPMDIVAWFIRNRTEYNTLARTIDPEVVGENIATMFQMDEMKVLDMESPSRAKLLWTMQFPAPLCARDFALIEYTYQRHDGSLVVLCRQDPSGDPTAPIQPIAKKKSISSRPKSTKSKYSVMSDTSVSEESTSFVRSLSRPLSGTLSALIRSVSGSAAQTKSLAAFTPAAPQRPTVKGKAYVLGYLFEPVEDRKFTRVTFVIRLDPRLTPSDEQSLTMFDTLMAPRIASLRISQHIDGDSEDREDDFPSSKSENASNVANSLALAPKLESSVRARTRASKRMSSQAKLTPDAKLEITLGGSRVLTQVESARRYFDDPKSIWAEQLYRLLSARNGEFGFQGVEAVQVGEERLQPGTHVTNRQFGHGIIKMFDLMGRVHVQYDSGEEHVYTPDEVTHELSAAVEVGTRVRHPERGLGTVKRFDAEEGKIHVLFDSGEYHRYNSESWKEKIRVENQGRAYANVQLSKCPQVEMEGITKGSNIHLHAGVRAPAIMQKRATLTGTMKRHQTLTPMPTIEAEAQRISFVIQASATDILDYIAHHTEDAKVGSIAEEHTLKEYSDRHRTMYQRVHYPQGLNDRDFIYDSFWQEVDEDTYLVVEKSTEFKDVPPKPNVVRATIVIRGYLLEPLYDSRDSECVGSDELMTRVTYLTCVEPNGMVPPKVVAAQNRTELLGALTDMRSYFWRRGQGIALSFPENAAKHASEEVHAKLKRRSLRRRSVDNVLPAL